MPERSEKQRRKEMVDQWKAQKRAAARAKFPLADEQFRALCPGERDDVQSIPRCG
jgi:hypothetical protein